MAAVAAARDGRSVLLLEPGTHVGGMVAGGLGSSDTGNRAAISGYAREFFDRVLAYYTATYGKGSAQVTACDSGFHFEPRVAAQIFAQMLSEARVTPRFGQKLAAVVTAGGTISALSMTSGNVYRGAVFIDASYEGDLMARAGVSFTVGREGGADFGESYAGVQAAWAQARQSIRPTGSDSLGNLLPGLYARTTDPDGSGDAKVQAYNFRVCTTTAAANRLPWARPSRYDAARYEMLARYLALRPTLTLAQVVGLYPLPNSKFDTNNNGVFSTDNIGANWAYPNGDDLTRAAIWQDHIDYMQGLFWFLASDSRVPTSLHNEVAGYGLCKDEFIDNGNWPHQLYVREARRMRGDFVMSQRDITDDRDKADAVALGSYTSDSHDVQRVLLADGTVLGEGGVGFKVSPYAIPYRVLLPKRAQAQNLLVPVAMSATHIAYDSLRMEPVYMALGHAAGMAASIAVQVRKPVQDIDVIQLRWTLAGKGMVLSPEQVLAAPAIDDSKATLLGNWSNSQSQSGYIGRGYITDGNEGKGLKSARFTTTLPLAANYELFFWYTPASNRASNVPVVINGTKLFVDERKPLPAPGQPVSLGVFALPLNVTIDVLNQGTNGYVVVDAVQLVRHFDGIVVDDNAATASPGGWTSSSSAPGFVGDGYRHDGNSGKPGKWIRFDASLPAAGRYQLFYYYSANANRASNVPVFLTGSNGQQQLLLDQRQPTSDGRASLGVFSLGTSASVEVRNDGTDGYVIADAVEFVPVR
jgi:hypothetical protein